VQLFFYVKIEENFLKARDYMEHLQTCIEKAYPDDTLVSITENDTGFVVRFDKSSQFSDLHYIHSQHDSLIDRFKADYPYCFAWNCLRNKFYAIELSLPISESIYNIVMSIDKSQICLDLFRDGSSDNYNYDELSPADLHTIVLICESWLQNHPKYRLPLLTGNLLMKRDNRLISYLQKEITVLS
jgi:hypothetical protein